jgi:hypothetical protein
VSRQAAALTALAAMAAAGAALSARAWLLLWRQWRARPRRPSVDLTEDVGSSRNEATEEIH